MTTKFKEPLSWLERHGTSEQEIALCYLKEFQSRPLDKDFDGEVADAFNQVIAFIEEFEVEEQDGN